MTTNVDGVSSNVDTVLTPDDCCAEALTNGNSELEVACEDTITVVEITFTWDEGTTSCTEIETSTQAGIPSIVETPKMP